MDYQLNTRLNGNIAMTSRFHENKPLQRDKTLYKVSLGTERHARHRGRPYTHEAGERRDCHAYPAASSDYQRGGRCVSDLCFQQ